VRSQGLPKLSIARARTHTRAHAHTRARAHTVHILCTYYSLDSVTARRTDSRDGMNVRLFCLSSSTYKIAPDATHCCNVSWRRHCVNFTRKKLHIKLSASSKDSLPYRQTHKEKRKRQNTNKNDDTESKKEK